MVFSGFTEALQWVCESLEEVALDQEAEGYNPDGESVPLVPIMLPCAEAMQNTLFQETLKCIGVDAPSDEQASIILFIPCCNSLTEVLMAVAVNKSVFMINM